MLISGELRSTWIPRMDNLDAIRRINEYAQRKGTTARPLSEGQDGVVWQTALGRNSVIKAFYRQENYLAELSCYQRLGDRGIEEIKGFHVPSLIDHDDELM